MASSYRDMDELGALLPEPLATLTGLRVPTTKPSEGAAVAAEEDVEAARAKLGPAVPATPDTAATDWEEYAGVVFQIGAGLYAVGRPVQKRNDEDGQIGTIQSLHLERGALFNRFFGEPAHGPPHVAGGASGPIGGCRDESRTDNPDLDLRHVFDRNNRKTDLI